jgi:phytoene desaturase
MYRYLQRFFEDDRIAIALSFQSKYLGMSPFRCPSLFSILAFLEYEYGVFHPIGGCGGLMRTMARIAEDLGAEIRLNDPVAEIDIRGRRAVSLRAASGVRDVDAVVVNADFAYSMMTLTPEEKRARWTDAHIRSRDFSCSCFMIFLGIEGTYDHLQHHNVYIAEDYVRNLHEIENAHVLSQAPSFYVQNVARTDATLAPEGHSTLYILVPVTHQHANVDWRREEQRYRDHVIGLVKEKLNLPDLDARIRVEHRLTPDDWCSEHGIHLGATFNMAHTFGQMLHKRPHNRFEDIDGVYLVGGGTHPGSGLPVIFESARISVGLLLEAFGMDRAWLYAED